MNYMFIEIYVKMVSLHMYTYKMMLKMSRVILSADCDGSDYGSASSESGSATEIRKTNENILSSTA